MSSKKICGVYKKGSDQCIRINKIVKNWSSDLNKPKNKRKFLKSEKDKMKFNRYRKLNELCC